MSRYPARGALCWMALFGSTRPAAAYVTRRQIRTGTYKKMRKIAPMMRFQQKKKKNAIDSVVDSERTQLTTGG